MSITKKRKCELTEEYRTSESDVGSVDVQCAILTERINNLTQHFKIHKKDHTSKRGLLMLVGRRKRLLRYQARTNKVKYESIVARLGIRVSAAMLSR